MRHGIILLDLNKTLAGEIKMNIHTFEYDVSGDVYRQDLVQAIKNKRIFLITARTSNYEKETKNKIAKDTGLQIERFYFKPESQKYLRVHEFKKQIVLSLFKEGFKPEQMFGIESNANTRAEYKKLNVESCSYADYMKRRQQCMQIGMGITNSALGL